MRFDNILFMMETIFELLSDMAERLQEIATKILVALIFIVILVTMPVWIVPYIVWKARKEKDRDDYDEDDNDKDYDAYVTATR